MHYLSHVRVRAYMHTYTYDRNHNNQNVIQNYLVRFMVLTEEETNNNSNTQYDGRWTKDTNILRCSVYKLNFISLCA